MKSLFAVIICLNSFVCSEIYSQQNFQQIPVKENINELKSKIVNQENRNTSIEKNSHQISSTSKSSKSPGLALLFSLLVPGTGHWYLNRMDVGKYFVGAEAISWMGYAALSVYGNDVSNQSKVYSIQHAEIGTTDGKDDDFFANIGSYKNVYEYNNYQLATGQYNFLYDVNTNYWNWDNLDNLNIYESQRKSSERIYNNRIIFGSMLVINRIVSGISAYLIATSQNKKKSASFSIEPELMYKNNYSFDGVKVNLSKNF